jgi:hypothetical protein
MLIGFLTALMMLAVVAAKRLTIRVFLRINNPGSAATAAMPNRLLKKDPGRDFAPFPILLAEAL